MIRKARTESRDGSRIDAKQKKRTRDRTRVRMWSWNVERELRLK